MASGDQKPPVYDPNGLLAATKTYLQAYCHNARQSGRTMAMVRGLKPGDVVVCWQHKEGERLRRLIRQQHGDDFQVTVMAISPHDGLHELHSKVSRTRRSPLRRSAVHLDHRFFEMFMENQLNDIGSSIGSLIADLNIEDDEPVPTIDKGNII